MNMSKTPKVTGNKVKIIKKGTVNTKVKWKPKIANVFSSCENF